MRGRVVIVTGGGGGIGSEVSLELARQGATVIVVDDGSGVGGEPLAEATAQDTVERIEAQGGRAIAAAISVTDEAAIQKLVDETLATHGTLDAVVNTAGAIRFPRIVDGTAEDWAIVLDVHIRGHLTMLAATLPPMVAAGRGRFIAVSSGVGLARTSVDGPAYGAAKRAVAALTWQLGPRMPAGVSVNALSPIAATRMVRASLAFAGADPGGLDLSAMPQPEHMAPAAARMAGDAFGWCRGRVIFSAGPELSLIAPPRLVEAFATGGVGAAAALPTLGPVVLTPAHEQQRSTGGSNPRFGPLDAAAAPTAATGADSGRTCLVVCDDRDLADGLSAALTPWGHATVVVPVGVSGGPDPVAGFMAAEEGIRRAAATSPTGAGLDAVIVVHGLDTPDAAPGVLGLGEPASGVSASGVSASGETASGGGPGSAVDWQAVLASHAGTAGAILTHAAWARAAARHAATSGQPLRIVHIVPATSPGGRSAAQAVTQLARCVDDTPAALPADHDGAPPAGGPARLVAFAISGESADPADAVPLAELAARLVAADDALPLAGAELVLRPGWIGLRTHPGPAATLSLAGADLGTWTDDALRDALDPFA